MSRPQTCSRCGEETRYGTRGGVTGYHHRLEVDHAPIFGVGWTPAMQTQLDEGIERLRLAKVKSKKAADVEVEPKQKWEEVPEPEERSRPIEAEEFPPRSGIRQIINLVDKTEGWERRRLTFSRGPYVGSSGEVLSISDCVVLGARGPTIEHGYADPLTGWVDSGTRVAVASWRDGKFDFAYTGILKDGVVATQPANSNALKAWIKDVP